MGITTLVFHTTQSLYKNSALGIRYFQKEQFQKALPYLTAAYKQEKNDPQICLYLAIVYNELGRKEDMIEALQNLSKITDDIATEQWLADSFYGTNNFLKAEQLYEQILSKTKDEKVFRKYAEVLAYQKKYDQVIMVLADHVKNNPQDNKLLELLADGL